MRDRLENRKIRIAAAEDKFVKQRAVDRTRNEGVIGYIKTYVKADWMSKYKTGWFQNGDRMWKKIELTVLQNLHAAWFNEPDKNFE
jgi:hypothetical protein